MDFDICAVRFTLHQLTSMEENISNTLKQWSEEDKPREKLLLKGKHTLSEAELIAILLRTGSQGLNVMDLSKRLLLLAGNDLNELGKWNINEILRHKSLKGMGKTKAITLVAALELGRRRQGTEVRQKPKITSSRDVYDILHPLMADLSEEQFRVLLLSQANKVLANEIISFGGRVGTVADVRVIFRQAILSNAVGIIVAHNHPSGNLKPSQSDIDLTHKLKQAGEVMDIKVLDHLIITDNGYYSFSDEGMM